MWSATGDEKPGKRERGSVREVGTGGEKPGKRERGSAREVGKGRAGSGILKLARGRRNREPLNNIPLIIYNLERAKRRKQTEKAGGGERNCNLRVREARSLDSSYPPFLKAFCY